VSAGPVVGAVLAAGAGRRFEGGPKQLARFAGRPLVEHPIAALAAARRVDRTLVVLGCGADEIRMGADLSLAEVVLAHDWEQGQSASLRAAVRAAKGEAAALVIVLGDQPLIAPAAVDAVIEHAGDRPARASYGERPGHPVLIPRRYFADLEGLRADTGARELLARLEVVAVDCDGLGDDADVDTTDDLERLAAATGLSVPAWFADRRVSNP
jgi:CTP:molybdopterin cytidylyltransferase MocA